MISIWMQILQRSGVPLPASASSAADCAVAMAIPVPFSSISPAQSAAADSLLAFKALMEAAGALESCGGATLSSGKCECFALLVYESKLSSAGLPISVQQPVS